MAEENGWFLTDQFRNPANARVHEETTGPEILAQAGGRVGAFVACAGTGGTITGVGRYLRVHCPSARIILADPIGSRLAHAVDPRHPDEDRAYAVEGVGSSVVPATLDLSVIDEAERVSDEESFATARRLLAEEGLFVGGSSGTAVVAALRMAFSGRVRGPVVALLADARDRYASRAWASVAASVAAPVAARGA